MLHIELTSSGTPSPETAAEYPYEESPQPKVFFGLDTPTDLLKTVLAHHGLPSTFTRGGPTNPPIWDIFTCYRAGQPLGTFAELRQIFGKAFEAKYETRFANVKARTGEAPKTRMTSRAVMQLKYDELKNVAHEMHSLMYEMRSLVSEDVQGQFDNAVESIKVRTWEDVWADVVSGSEGTVPEPSAAPPYEKKDTYKLLFEFPGQNEMEMSSHKDEVIEVLRKDDNGEFNLIYLHTHDMDTDDKCMKKAGGSPKNSTAQLKAGSPPQF